MEFEKIHSDSTIGRIGKNIHFWSFIAPNQINDNILMVGLIAIWCGLNLLGLNSRAHRNIEITKA